MLQTDVREQWEEFQKILTKFQKYPQQYWRNPIEVLKRLHNKYTIISQQQHSDGSCQTLILYGKQPKNTIKNDQNKSKVAPK